MKRTPTTVTIALAAALSAGIAVPVLTQAQTPAATRTITFQETRPLVAMDDIAPKAKSKSDQRVSLGDRLITTGPLFDVRRKRLGTISGDCTAVGPTKPIFAAQLLCTVAYQVADGQIVAAGNFKLDGSGTLAIVGGTGAYSGTHGTVTSSVQPAKGFEDADVITLQG